MSGLPNPVAERADSRDPDAGELNPRRSAWARVRRQPWVWLLPVLAGSALIMLGAQLAASVLDRELSFLTREPQAALTGAWYAGAISNVGALLWAMGVTACLLAWLVERERGRAAVPLLVAAPMLAIIAADDLFLLHEGLYTKVVDERLVFGSYLVLLVAYLVVFRDFLRSQDGFAVLAFGIALLVVSGVFDQFLKGYHLIEDGTKLAGIATISFLFTVTAYRRLTAGGRS